MNKEIYNQIIDEAYENYKKEIIRQREIQKEEVNRLRSQGKRVRVILIELLSKEEFINKCKTDNEFSEKWGLKIEERELSLEERHQISLNRIGHDGIADRDNITWHETYNKTGIPTKIITLTHNNETAITYE